MSLTISFSSACSSFLCYFDDLMVNVLSTKKCNRVPLLCGCPSNHLRIRAALEILVATVQAKD